MDILEETYFYHIFNRGNNKQPIFLENDNYQYFLNITKKHILPVADIYCYCLLNNHFHFLVRIKESTTKPSQAFSNLFNAYAKAFNKKYNKSGSLFQRPFKRIRITEKEYLRKLIIYIHRNPQNHGITSDFETYQFSSYSAILSNKTTNLSKNEVIQLFDNRNNFKYVHQQNPSMNDNLIF